MSSPLARYCPGILNRIHPGCPAHWLGVVRASYTGFTHDIQPITSLIILVSMLEMIRGPAWCPYCLLRPGSPKPGCTLVKKRPARCHHSKGHLTFISHPYLTAPYSQPVIQWWCGPSKQGSFTPATWLVTQWRCGPSKQGSFMPAKGTPQSKGRTDDWVGCAHGLNKL